MNSIKNWAEDDRPREKLLHKGAAVLSDAELLAILLRSGTRGMNAVELARQLLRDFGSLRAVFTATLPELQRHKGLGLAAYTQFATVREIGKRLLAEEMTQLPSISDPQAVAEYLRLAIGFETVEVMLALFLDRQNRIVAAEELGRGTLTENTVYIREIAKKALAHHASALIIAHNHPAGSASASDADRMFTVRLRAALNLLDINLLDHVIVTAQETVSFAAQGWLPR
ncbi:MAG: DNA repair protein RadC [Neisseria sp.]|nr:DNA repair protein RadC [Neisseria sp.]